MFQASLFLALGIMFSLVSIPLVIYDWVQSGGSAEGHWSSPPSEKKTPVCYTPKSQPSVLLSSPSFVSLLKSNPNNDYPVLKVLSWAYFLAENRPISPTGISLCPPILSYQISAKSVLVVYETVQSIAHRNSSQLICFPSSTHELHCSIVILSPSTISSAPLGQKCLLLSIPTGVMSAPSFPPAAPHHLFAKTPRSKIVCIWFVGLFVLLLFRAPFVSLG